MQIIPIQPEPSQTLQVVLDSQNCQINIYQKDQGLFVDIILDGNAISSAVIARDSVPLMPRTYLSFKGNLMFVDTQGASDPYFDSLGSRYQLVYLNETEYAVI